jgi:hypothetical protein
MKIEVSIGEIVDKLSILVIKKNNIKDEAKLRNIIAEHDHLYEIVFTELKIEEADLHTLNIINGKLWQIEDSIREKEARSQFDQEFIELARQVYKTNDLRAKVKKKVNIKYKSNFVEEKSYQ